MARSRTPHATVSLLRWVAIRAAVLSVMLTIATMLTETLTSALAQQNRHVGQTGQGMSALLRPSLTSSPGEQEPSAKRAVPTTEACEHWKRDRLKECGQMNDVLNHSRQK
ncbi:uncharacterized protein DEA37_0005449 [Paragonimus westermani]|uniref:Uncharacterized protein n=1 Tax=Paragonimus westermani TaxID=34504 RepID=A0A5J4NK61_9TREM|nr:uncharacterized protein DEA37_0005449 [Paragonimus westermani]